MVIKDLSGTQGSGLTLVTNLVCDIKKTILFPYSLLLYLSKTLLPSTLFLLCWCKLQALRYNLCPILSCYLGEGNKDLCRAL